MPKEQGSLFNQIQGGSRAEINWMRLTNHNREVIGSDIMIIITFTHFVFTITNINQHYENVITNQINDQNTQIHNTITK